MTGSPQACARVRAAPNRRDERPKRFYETVSTAPEAGGVGIRLDGRALKTPARAPLAVPTQALADAVADEWAAQGDKIDMASMRLTGLANAAIDRIAPERAAFARRLSEYGRSDLLCYRAVSPVELVARQAKGWEPWLDWLDRERGVRLRIGEGVMHVAQDETAMARLYAAVAALDPFRLAGLQIATTATGSMTLGLAVAALALPAGEAFELSRIDEEHQAEVWGRDAEAEARAAAIRAEIEAAGRFLSLL